MAVTVSRRGLLWLMAAIIGFSGVWGILVIASLVKHSSVPKEEAVPKEWLNPLFRVTVRIPSGAFNPSLRLNFEPRNVVLILGVNNTIVWVNEDEEARPKIMIRGDLGEWESPFLSGWGAWSHTFTAPGTYTYWTAAWPWMRGEVVVLLPP